MPIIIPLLATGYLLTIYLLLMLAQRTTKNSRYAANPVVDAYASASYTTADKSSKIDEIERWSLRLSGATSLAYPPKSRSSKRGVNELEPSNAAEREVEVFTETGN